MVSMFAFFGILCIIGGVGLASPKDGDAVDWHMAGVGFFLLACAVAWAFAVKAGVL